MPKILKSLGVLLCMSPFFLIAQSGCVDSTACNYDSLAVEDDGTCCFDNCISIDMGEIIAWDGITWTMTDESGIEVASGGIPFNIDLCLPTGCYDIVVTDENGNEWNVLIINILDEDGNPLLDYAWDIGVIDLSSAFSFCIPEICDGPDFSCDLDIDTEDLIIFLSNFGCLEDCTCDLTGDGLVLTDDLIEFLSYLGL